MGRRLTKLALKHRLAEQRDERESLKEIGGNKAEFDALMFKHWAELDGDEHLASVPAWALPSIEHCSDDCPACCPDCGQGHGEDTLDCERCRT